MGIKYYWNLLLGKTNAERPAKLSIQNAKAVVQSIVRKHKMDGFELDSWIYEQIIWRRTQVILNSPRCWYAGTCKVCGCDILGKTMEDRGCSISEHPDLMQKRDPCYPSMMNEEDWERFKKTKNIKLFN